MPGLLIFAFFATLLVLRLTRAPGSALSGGIVLMGFGIWLLLDATKHSRFNGSLVEPPQLFVLLLGLWCVRIGGVLRITEVIRRLDLPRGLIYPFIRFYG
jgi:hypothetical protein